MSEVVLAELLLRWESLRDSGCEISLTELCGEHPELLPEIERRVKALLSINKFLEPSDESASSEPLVDEASACAATYGPVSTESHYANFRSYARGGLGEIFVARDAELQRDVAVKVIQAPYDKDLNRRRRFIREAEITGRLEHPGIVPVHGVGYDKRGYPCYTMRLIEGENLQVAIEKLHAIPEADRDRDSRKLLQRFISVCNTIAFAHSRHVLHRDIKPTNIMLGMYGETLVVDWGLAKQLVEPDVNSRIDRSTIEEVEFDGGWYEEPNVTHDGVQSTAEVSFDDEATVETPSADAEKNEPLTEGRKILGTPSFMSPEQARGDAVLTPSADIFSLGATLYTILTGRPPYLGETFFDVVEQACERRLRSPKELKPGLPLALDAICLKALSRVPEERYPTALDLANDLDRWMLDDPISARQDTWLESASRFARRHRAWAQAAVLSLIAITAISISFAVVLVRQIQVTETQREAAIQLSKEKAAIAEEERKARGKAEELTEEKIRLVESESHARKLADNESKLALQTLATVVSTMQKRLSKIEDAQDARRDLLKTAIDGLSKISASIEARQDATFYVSQAHREIGQILFNIGDSVEGNSTERAMEHFSKATEIMLTLSEKLPEDLTVQRQLSISFESLGDVYIQIGELNLAFDAFEKSLAISKRLYEHDSQGINADRDLAFGYEKLGDVHMKVDKLPDAKAAYELVRHHLEEAVRKHPNNGALARDFVVNSSKLSNVLVQEGNLEQAALVLHEAIDKCKSVSSKEKQSRDQIVLANQLGEVLLKQGKVLEAGEEFVRSLEASRKLAELNPTSLLAQRDLAVALAHIGEIKTLSKQVAEAREILRECLTLRQRISSNDVNNLPSQIDVARVLVQLSRLESDAVDKAKAPIAEALLILNRLNQQGALTSADEKLLLQSAQAEAIRLGI